MSAMVQKGLIGAARGLAIVVGFGGVVGGAFAAFEMFGVWAGAGILVGAFIIFCATLGVLEGYSER